MSVPLPLPVSASDPLLEPSLLRRLDALRLAQRRPARSLSAGSRRSARRGMSAELADYREYAPGDDLRAVDWNAYGRLEKLFLKLFVDEEDLALHLLLDLSGSMAFGSPVPKSLMAKRLAAALGYVALSRADRVAAASISSVLSGPAPLLRGAPGVAALFHSLQQMPVRGKTEWGRALGRYAAQAKTPGTAILFSDFYEDTWLAGALALRARRFSVVLVQVLTPWEMRPLLEGDARLSDAESGAAQDGVSPDLLEQYDTRLRAFLAAIEANARRYDMDYIRIETDTPLELALRALSGPGGVLA